MAVKKVQPEINIGLVGHVDHGKTTLTERFSGKWADTHSEELKRGITIRLGYADTTFVKTKDGSFSTEAEAKKQKLDHTVVRKVSFIDAPGHESLMATMLCGMTIMDGALLLVAANEECPQPQTREHLMALEIAQMKNVIIVQNKIDLVSEEKALENHKQIKAFLKGTAYEDAPIIPISAQHNVNIDLLIQTIEEVIKTPKRDPKADPRMFVARSFDVNKPGALPAKMVGGVLGGSLGQGKLKVGDEIEIRPGHEVEAEGKKTYEPIFTTISGLKAGSDETKELGPGGSIGIMTTLDPAVVKSDRLSGSVTGLKGKLPPVWYSFTLKTTLLERVVGAKDSLVVDTIKKGEVLMLNVNSSVTVGMVQELGKDEVTCLLKRPVCADIGSRVTISRQMGGRFRLIGYGEIQE